jgi:hypothetical protein
VPDREQECKEKKEARDEAWAAVMIRLGRLDMAMGRRSARDIKIGLGMSAGHRTRCN